MRTSELATRPRTRSVAVTVLAVALFCAYAVMSVTKHFRLRSSGFDLGIFEQGIRGYAGWGAPVAPLKGPGVHLLGDHFHPILMLLAPIYRIFPGPVTLLIAQAALLAVSAVPVTRLAIRRFGTRGGLAVGAAYGLSWGLQRAAGFDFHEICFAVPLLAFSLEALADRRWAAAVAWAAPLVLVKEDLPATVAALGAYLILHGRRRLGWATGCAAVAAGLLIVEVLIPAFNVGHGYGYATGSAPLSGVGQKLLTVVMLLLPTGFLAVRSPILLLAVPTLAWRFWSANPSYWGTEFHYSAVLMPIVFVAMLDTPPARSGRWLPAWCLTVALLLTTMLPLNALADPATWRPDPAATAARTTLHRIPDDATVAADNRLAPHLTARCEVYLFPFYPNATVRPTWVAIPDTPSTDPRSVTAREALPALGYRLVSSGSGVSLFTRPPGT